MPKISREEVDVTSTLKNILDNYPTGSAILREILQNSDDAKAKTQTFILDTRTFESNLLVDPVLSVCQGPAIIATNDTCFKRKNWVAIKTILDSSKTQDEASTGKYGLGFRSCYHITDNPHILSRKQLHILDPHKRVKNYEGGIELSTTRKPDEDGGIDREAYKDHFATFDAVLKDEDEEYQGTAIRLPLRLPGFKSKLKSTPTTVADARKMFQDFIAKELPEAILFLKHITSIKFSEIDYNGDETVLATADITSQPAPSWNGEASHRLTTITMHVGPALPQISKWLISHFVEEDETVSKHLAQRLGRSEIDVQAAMEADKLRPRVDLAFPIPQNGSGATCIPELNGRLYTLLPLPIITNFPVHINAVFALVSSRQNLRNSLDVVSGSREEFLVEWNRVIFSKFVPKAWALLLDSLSTQLWTYPPDPALSTINIFNAWPSPVATEDGDQGYWYPAPTRLLEEAAREAVWPLHGEYSEFRTLKDIFVVAEGDDGAPLAAFKACDVPFVIVPEHVFTLIDMSQFDHIILSPGTAYSFFKANSNMIFDLDASAKRFICDYLVSAGNINFILDLPIIPQVQGQHTSIIFGREYIMSTKAEAKIFGQVDPKLLAGESMSAATRKLLLHNSAKMARSIHPSDVVRYLEQRLPTLGETGLVDLTAGVEPETFDWLIKFWSWLDEWERFDELIEDPKSWSALQDLHALPLRLTGGKRRGLRLVGHSAVRSENMDRETVEALIALGVPILADSISDGSAVQYVSREYSDIVFILQSIPKNKSFVHLNQAVRQTLHNFFNQQLLEYLRVNSRASSGGVLKPESRRILRTLPIFPVLNPGSREEASITFDVAPNGACFVDGSVEVIPTIEGTPFISYDLGKVLHTGLGETDVLGEIDVLREAICSDAWEQQEDVPGLLPGLIHRLINRLNDLGDVARAKIRELAIVEVGSRGVRQRPSQVVDPASELAGLYDANDKVLPVGDFANEGPGSYINQLRSHEMIRSTLTPSAIKERVTRISDQSQTMQKRSQKALRLLKLLDSYIQTTKKELSTEIVQILCDSAWLPVDGKFYNTSECWDSRKKDALLCDFVLPRVSYTVRSSYLRNCLEWSHVPLETLQCQLLKVVEAARESSDISQSEAFDRVEAVLRELALELQADCLSVDQVDSLVEALGDSAWVPVSSRDLRAGQQSMLEQIDLGTKYHSVSPTLLQADGIEMLLKEMGVPTRPPPVSLYSTLREISQELAETELDGPTRKELIDTSISILEELARSIKGDESEFRKILVPTQALQLAPATEVLFNDMAGDSMGPFTGFQFAHPRISPSLAITLGLRRLSEEEFSQAEDGIQSFHIGEDLTVRIRGVLKDYGIDHSSNEWIANADDAGARSVTFLLDEASFKSQQVIGGLGDFQSGPALVVHNNAVFKDVDLKGLGRIGQGGKSGRDDSIGRFGLGALSFYHFSELPWVISGKYCLFLDPSKKYLPREKGNIRRSAALVPLSHCINRYPDQLKPLDGLFGFSLEADNYKGTIFRFPLRTASQAAASKLSSTHFSPVDLANTINRFYANASQSLFFTKSLAEITAMRRAADLRTTSIWSVSCAREKVFEGMQKEMIAIKVSLKLKAPDTAHIVAEHWLVTSTHADKDGFPTPLRTLFPLHHLPTPTFGLAVNLSANSSIPNSRLFATLPLPISTSLPVHVHATWILAQDRRSIRYDAPDATGLRPLDTLYNEHILKNAIAPLYIRTLALIVAQYPKVASQIWPNNARDDLSVFLAAELYKQMIFTKEPVLLTARNQPIAPSAAIIRRPHKSPLVIRNILSKIKAHNYVPIPHFDTSFLKDWGILRFDSAKEVSKILREYSVTIRQLWQPTNPASSALTVEDILSVSEYLSKEGESLIGIPLLLRGDCELVEFQIREKCNIFASHRADLARLFGSRAIVSMEIPEVSVQNLVNLNLNVVTLDPRGMRDLLAQHSPVLTPANIRKSTISLCDWCKELLNFLASPKCPVKIDDLADLPLLPAVGQEVLISLNHARSGGIWWRSRVEDAVLTTVLLQLGVIAVDDLLDSDELQGPRTNDLARILKLFGQLNLSSQEILQRVDPNDWAKFAHHLMPWTRNPFLSNLSAAEFKTLTNLPFFQGKKGNNLPIFVPASQVLMLPDLVPLDHLAQYLPPKSTFAAASPELAAVLRRSKATDRSLSFSTLFSRLRLPSQIAPHQETSFSSLLQLVTTHHDGHYNGELIPDGNCVLRRPTELYDHRVPLFSTAFEGRKDLFVHPAFRTLIDGLVDIGVKRHVSSQRLVECLRAVDHDAQQGPQPVHRARWLWEYVNSAPPELREIPFDAIRRLRFLPRQTQRHPSDPDFDVYARSLPDVVSFDDLCTPEREVLAWTQRARFTTFPSAHLKAIYSSIGEPTPNDVVQHLVSLANDVAPHHYQSSILFSNIRSVYKWLKNNKDEVKDELDLLSEEPLWLNTDSVSDHWTWRTADQLVFDIAYDAGGRFVVRNFLIPYRSLLLDAGAHEYKVASPPTHATPKKTTPHPEIVRSGWDELRQAGQLLDICFSVQGQEIPAHRGMLAAVVPHFKTAFGGSFRESVITAEDTKLPVYRLPEDEAASAFAVQSVVDYVYTGTFSLPTFADIDEATEALDDLLDLMELSNLWDIPDLTNQTVLAMVELRLIRFDNCDYVLEIAEESQIELLIEICQKTKEQNQWL